MVLRKRREPEQRNRSAFEGAPLAAVADTVAEAGRLLSIVDASRWFTPRRSAVADLLHEADLEPGIVRDEPLPAQPVRANQEIERLAPEHESLAAAGVELRRLDGRAQWVHPGRVLVVFCGGLPVGECSVTLIEPRGRARLRILDPRARFEIEAKWTAIRPEIGDQPANGGA